MYNVVFMKTFESLYNLTQYSQSFFLAQSSLFLDVSVKTTSVTVFANQI
jgi:hypothetical protein